jgi:hypothetical protein
VFRVCGRWTKEATVRKPVKCNQELRMTGGERCEVGDKMQRGIKRRKSTNVKIFVQGNEEQECGFRKGRSTTDQIFCLRMILERACEYKLDVHVCQLYIDYKQSYDTINRTKLVEIMRVWNTSEVGKIGHNDLSEHK